MPKQIILNNKNSFATEDIKSQAKKVIDTILKNNSFSQEKRCKLFDLRKSILSNSLIDSLGSNNNDVNPWNRIMKIENVKRHWFDNVHHGLAISYFHRLILEKIDYFESKKDPYEKIKQRALISFIGKNWIEGQQKDLTLEQILIGMLWGNKTDFVPPLISRQKVLLTDDRESLIKFLLQKKAIRIDIISDNVGEELFYDILFINYLFVHGLVKTVKYHVKNYPYNVSDITKQDFFWTLNFLALSENNTLRNIANNILDLISKNYINIITYPFTTLGLDRKLAMNVVKKQYMGSSLIITKGDFNYRKNLGWYYWDIKDKYQEIVSYLKCPLACFRVIKNEILTGLKNQTSIYALSKKDPNWWKKGKGGTIIFTFPNNNDYLECNTVENFWNQTIHE